MDDGVVEEECLIRTCGGGGENGGERRDAEGYKRGERFLCVTP